MSACINVSPYKFDIPISNSFAYFFGALCVLTKSQGKKNISINHKSILNNLKRDNGKICEIFYCDNGIQNNKSYMGRLFSYGKFIF